MSSSKVIIGNEEWCSFPGLGVPAIKARVDSGAKTSALHAFNIQRFLVGNVSWLSFDLHPLQDNRKVVVHCKAPLHDRRWVKSSSGQSERRYVICVPMQLGNFLWKVEVTLTNRDSMGYRMLLGRNAMQDRVLVDPARGCYLGEPGAARLADMYTAAVEDKPGLNITILSNNPDLYGNQRLLEAARERDHHVHIVDVARVGLQMSGHAAHCYMGSQLLDKTDVVIPRFSARFAYYGCTLLQHFQQCGVYPVNSAQAIRQVRDPLATLQTLQQYHIPLPAFSFTPDAQYARIMIEQVGGTPLLLKSLADQGESVTLVRSPAAAEAIIQTMQERGMAVYAQSYDSSCQQRLLRCLVLHDRVLAVIDKPMKVNGARPKKPLPREALASPDEQKLAVRVAQSLNLALAAVDILRTDSGPQFFAITPNPGFEDIESCVDINIAQQLLRCIEEKFQHKVNTDA